MFRSNFDSPGRIWEDQDRLTVTGTSQISELPSAVSREVIITQGKAVASGFATSQDHWAADIQGVAGFVPGDALAVGSQTHLMPEPSTVVTVTWTEIIQLEHQLSPVSAETPQ